MARRTTKQKKTANISFGEEIEEPLIIKQSQPKSKNQLFSCPPYKTFLISSKRGEKTIILEPASLPFPVTQRPPCPRPRYLVYRRCGLRTRPQSLAPIVPRFHSVVLPQSDKFPHQQDMAFVTKQTKKAEEGESKRKRRKKEKQVKAEKDVSSFARD